MDVLFQPFQVFLDLCATGENMILLQKWTAVHTNMWSIINSPEVDSQDTDNTEENFEQHQIDSSDKLWNLALTCNHP